MSEVSIAGRNLLTFPSFQLRTAAPGICEPRKSTNRRLGSTEADDTAATGSTEQAASISAAYDVYAPEFTATASPDGSPTTDATGTSPEYDESDGQPSATWNGKPSQQQQQ